MFALAQQWMNFTIHHVRFPNSCGAFETMLKSPLTGGCSATIRYSIVVEPSWLVAIAVNMNCPSTEYVMSVQSQSSSTAASGILELLISWYHTVDFRLKFISVIVHLKPIFSGQISKCNKGLTKYNYYNYHSGIDHVFKHYHIYLKKHETWKSNTHCPSF